MPLSWSKYDDRKTAGSICDLPASYGCSCSLCLWVLLGVLQIDRLGDGYEWPPFIPLVSDDRGPLVKQMQGALVKKGYSIGPAGADGNLNGDTLTALGAFQHDNALPA